VASKGNVIPPPAKRLTVQATPSVKEPPVDHAALTMTRKRDTPIPAYACNRRAAETAGSLCRHHQ
jgi:hypothetical protein